MSIHITTRITTEEEENDKILGFKTVTKNNLAMGHVEIMQKNDKIKQIEDFTWRLAMPDLSLKAKGLYAMMLFLPKELGGIPCWDRTINNLKESCEDKDEMYSTLEELASYGAFRICKIMPKKRQKNAEPTYYYELWL